MLTDPHNRVGNCRWRGAAFVLLNLRLLGGLLVLYCVSRAIMMPRIGPGVWASHGHDLLAVPTLAAFLSCYLVAMQAPVHAMLKLGPIMVLSLGAGLFWEYVTPLYCESTSDPFDLAAYMLGGLAYFVTVRSWICLRFRRRVRR